MELASMLAGEPFSDRARSVSPVIGAFLRTYNDGLDDERRQDLYPVASLVVGTAADRATEDERASRALEFAQRLGTRSPLGRAAVALGTPEAAGTAAALAAFRADAHEDALELVGDLAALRRAPRFPRVRRLLGRNPAEAVEAAVEAWQPSEPVLHA
jgi:hypothetical protein